MAIDLQEEEVLGLTDAARSMPRIGGKRPHPSTLWRWIRQGVGGVHLEHIRLGHRVCTSREALARFTQALADADHERVRTRVTPQSPMTRTVKQRAKDIARANRRLAAAGIA